MKIIARVINTSSVNRPYSWDEHAHTHTGYKNNNNKNTRTIGLKETQRLFVQTKQMKFVQHNPIHIRSVGARWMGHITRRVTTLPQFSFFAYYLFKILYGKVPCFPLSTVVYITWLPFTLFGCAIIEYNAKRSQTNSEETQRKRHSVFAVLWLKSLQDSGFFCVFHFSLPWTPFLSIRGKHFLRVFLSVIYCS